MGVPGVGIQGGYWEGYTGCLATLLEEGPVDSEAGPSRPAGAGAVVYWSRTRPGTDPPTPDPAGPPGPASLVSTLSPGKCRLWANKGEIRVIFLET